jgi:hypothetical protein
MVSQMLSGTPAPAAVVERTAASPSFERFAGLCALAAGMCGFLYAVAFVVLRNPGLSGLLLLLGGLLSTAALLAVYERLRPVDGSFALLAAVFGVAGVLGSAVHGGYDLANALNPPASAPGDFPSQVDPRGLLTFGVAGLGLLLIAWLIGRGQAADRPLPAGLGVLGYVLAALLIILYLGRLIILDPTNLAIVIPVVLTGFIVNPAWYVWLGLTLWRSRRVG